jgi:hypothetical protein
LTLQTSSSRTAGLRARHTSVHLTLLALLAPVMGCGDGVRISLQLSTAQNGNPPAVASELRSLTVLIDNGEINDRESFEINREEQVLVPEMSVDKTKVFFMEVWGCELADQCELEDVILRGCTVEGLDVRNQSGETVIVEMTMYDTRDDTLRLCPSIGS